MNTIINTILTLASVIGLIILKLFELITDIILLVISTIVYISAATAGLVVLVIASLFNVRK